MGRPACKTHRSQLLRHKTPNRWWFPYGIRLAIAASKWQASGVREIGVRELGFREIGEICRFLSWPTLPNADKHREGPISPHVDAARFAPGIPARPTPRSRLLLMQSDQKIGLCLLIGLLGFATAIGFGRRERPAAPINNSSLDQRVATEELLPIDQLQPTSEEQPDDLQMQTVELPAPTATPTRTKKTNESLQADAFDAATATDENHLTGVNPEISPAEATEQSSLPEISDPATDESNSHQVTAQQQEQFVPYVVRSRDTLSGIAVKFYGDGNRYLDVYRANRDLLAHPDALQVGQTLRIPVPPSHSSRIATDDLAIPR